ncbi:MAG: hypothetical protein J6B87_07285 [Clostridia bacterium]|nr:hypothetical protein [Clostridia bacterium]
MTYYFIDDFNNICRQKEGIDKDFAEVIDLVDLIDDINKLHDENKELKGKASSWKITASEEISEKQELIKQIEKLKEENEILTDAFEQHLKRKHNRIKELKKENEQLQERNNRQAKQLDNLYTLIEKQDWKTLTGLIQEFQECEEQLQREWSDYE